MEVHTPYAGVVSEVFAAEGSEVNVGQKLFIVKEGVVSAPAPAAPAAKPSKVEPEKPKAATTPAPAPPKPAAGFVPSAPAKSAPHSGRSETRVKMSRMRLRIAQRLKEAQNTAAMLTTFQEVDMTAIMGLRTRYKDEFEKTYGVKLGFMGAFVKVGFCY